MTPQNISIMSLADPSDDTLERVLFHSLEAHVYNIPPLTSMKGHQASLWTDDPSRHIFTPRVRIVEISSSSTSSHQSQIQVKILLEDPSTGNLFASAPYTSPTDVESVTDSSRFFALALRDEATGKKAIVGLGFQERSDAFDFGVALQEARKGLSGFGDKADGGGGKGGRLTEEEERERREKEKDLSLKEGETIKIYFGGRFVGRTRTGGSADGDDSGGFVLSPPPGPGPKAISVGGGSGFSSVESSNPVTQHPPADSAASFGLKPPPTSQQRKQEAEALGFDDGEFGEFA